MTENERGRDYLMGKHRKKQTTKSRLLLAMFCLISVSIGCSSDSTPTLPPIPETVLNFRPGVYVTNEASDLPLPTSGYDLYVIGEPHGEHEVRLLTLDYLKTLHRTIGVRDIILEQISPAHEREVNAYVIGLDDTVSNQWAFENDLVVGVRMFNDTLPDSEKVRVHLVDLDLGLSNVHSHLQVLHEEIGTAAEGIQMPSLSEFSTWNEDEMLALVDQLAEVAEDREVVANELTTVKDSTRWFFLGKQFERGQIPANDFVDYEVIREERITENIQRLMGELGDTPALALYGGWHAQKRPAQIVTLYLSSQPAVIFLDTPSWVQRLAESGVSIYSVLAMGISGHAGVKGKFQEPVERDPRQMHFVDGITIADAFDAFPQCNIVYVDLRLDENASFRLGNDYQNVPAGEIYDGVVLFRKVRSVEWEEYP